MRFFIIILILSSSCSTYRVYNVKRLQPREGLYYSLPLKEYKVEITYERITSKKGVLFNESLRSRIENLPSVTKIYKDTTITLVKDISLTPTLKPDSSQLYFIEFRGKNNPFYTKKLNFNFSNSGILTSGNTSTSQNLLSSIPKLISPIVEFFGPGASVYPVSGLESSLPDEIQIHFDDEEVDMAPSERVLSRLSKMQEFKYEILSGDMRALAAYQGTNLADMLEQLRKEEAELLPLLVGTSQSTTWKKVVSLRPKNNQKIYDLDSYCPTIKDSLLIKAEIKNINNDTTNTKSHQILSNGIMYRLASYCEITIYEENISKSKKNEIKKIGDIIPQMGQLVRIPNRVGIFKNEIQLSFDKESASLIGFTANSSSIDKENLDIYNDINSTIQESRSRPLDSEIEQLEKEIKYLELRKKLNTIRGEINQK